MDLNKECQWQPNPLESHYYPSRCWALILEARELERFYATRVKSEKDFPILPENSIISAAERLLRDYRTHRVPFLGHIAERSGTVPYTLRVTLYTLLTICSKLRGCGELVRDRLKGIVHTFLGNYNAEYESLLRGLLTEAMFPEYSAEKVNVYIFYTDVLCSLMHGTSEKVYPGAIDLLRKYFANAPVATPSYGPGQPMTVEDEEFVGLGSTYYFDWAFGTENDSSSQQPRGNSLTWPKVYDQATATLPPLPKARKGCGLEFVRLCP